MKRTATAVGLLLVLAAIYIATPGDFFQRLASAPPALVATVTTVALVNLINVAVRFWRFLVRGEYKIRFWDAFRASAAGNLAALYFVPVIAQVAGRQAVMQRYGLGSVVTAAVSGYERVLLAAVSAVLALVAAYHLFSPAVVVPLIEQLALPQMTLVMVSALGLCWVLRIGAVRYVARGISGHRLAVGAVMEALLLTLISQALMILMFALVFHWAAPGLSVMQLVACGALVSFAASLPLSFGGWGPREAASIAVLGGLGIDPAAALAASALAGICSSAAVLLLAPLVWVKAPRS